MTASNNDPMLRAQVDRARETIHYHWKGIYGTDQLIEDWSWLVDSTGGNLHRGGINETFAAMSPPGLTVVPFERPKMLTATQRLGIARKCIVDGLEKLRFPPKPPAYAWVLSVSRDSAAVFALGEDARIIDGDFAFTPAEIAERHRRSVEFRAAIMADEALASVGLREADPGRSSRGAKGGGR